MKITEFIRYYSLSDLCAKSEVEGGSVPAHQLWNWDFFKAKGYLLNEAVPMHLSKNKVIKQLYMDNIQQQRKVIDIAKNSDVIYAPFMGDAYYIALLRMLHLCGTPLVAVAQETWQLNYSSSFLNYLKQWFLRFVAKHGVDRLLFISEGLYDQCKDYFDCKERQIPLKHWGIDVDYYESYMSSQQNAPTNDYIFVTGGANRDFDLMKRVAQQEQLQIPIFIQTNRCPSHINSSKNIRVDRSPCNWKDLLAGYYNAAAVAVPLALDLNYMSGITVVLEGMACGKPIISTNSKHYPFDIEKERCGFYIPLHDEKGWVEAINYISTHVDEAKEMGDRGKYIVTHKHNYQMFCNELLMVMQGLG